MADAIRKMVDDDGSAAKAKRRFIERIRNAPDRGTDGAITSAQHLLMHVNPCYLERKAIVSGPRTSAGGHAWPARVSLSLDPFEIDELQKRPRAE
jgi:hypothetical protein